MTAFCVVRVELHGMHSILFLRQFGQTYRV